MICHNIGHLKHYTTESNEGKCIGTQNWRGSRESASALYIHKILTRKLCIEYKVLDEGFGSVATFFFVWNMSQEKASTENLSCTYQTENITA